MADTETMKMLRREMEGWREILVKLRSMILWENKLDPVFLMLSVTIGYMMVYFLDPSVLTLLSLCGLGLVLCDYIIPQVTPRLFGVDTWTGADEKNYEQVITSICHCFTASEAIKEKIFNTKKSQPKVFFCMAVSLMTCLAWIGSCIDNTFLVYIAVLFTMLYPGLKRDHRFKEFESKTFGRISSLLRKVSGSSNKASEPVKKD